MKSKLKHWTITLNNGDYTIAGQIWAKSVTRKPSSNIVIADGVEINFGLIVAEIEEAK